MPSRLSNRATAVMPPQRQPVVRPAAYDGALTRRGRTYLGTSNRSSIEVIRVRPGSEILMSRAASTSSTAAILASALPSARPAACVQGCDVRRPGAPFAGVGAELDLDDHGPDRAVAHGQSDHRVGPVLRGSDVGEVTRRQAGPLEVRHRNAQRTTQQLGGQRRPLAEHLDQHLVQMRRHDGEVSDTHRQFRGVTAANRALPGREPDGRRIGARRELRAYRGLLAGSARMTGWADDKRAEPPRDR